MSLEFINSIHYERAKSINSLGCCLLCSLRLSGIPKNDNFQNLITNTDTIKNIFENSESEETLETPKICIICLGILQSKVQNASLEQISEAIRLNGYDSQTFTCGLNLPISIVIREKSLLMYLAQKSILSNSPLDDTDSKSYSVKEIWKMQMLPKIETMTSKQLTTCSLMSSPFTVNISYTYLNDEIDCEKLVKKYNVNSLKMKNRKLKDCGFSKSTVEKILSNITDEIFMDCYSVPPSKPSVPAVIDQINCTRESLFIGGRYIKLSRKLSQTPWFVNGEKKMETSVQDLLCDLIVKYTKAESCKFLSSGREDIDVRTINTGRPFAIELINPKITKFSPEKFIDLVEKINSSSKLAKITSNLRILSPLDLKRLKEGENVKKKFYRSLCIIKNYSENPLKFDDINLIKNLKITQKTPIRVLHRRPLASRIRIVHEMRARYLSPTEINEIKKRLPTLDSHNLCMGQLFIIDIKTQAGTYIKEFVHGDFGRTKPNLCDLLGVEIDIVALDVTGINIDWP
ncbi:tRNA pseudouridine synthase Pus10 [Microplitis mediator]|uniref:tRNA pseudouridine synthase Pus10 n=1 Tax=Microplitis mediator TaxID=375433 RepID=UPI002556B7A6|nr:tRNA pseudouridine synthase Pus10 [Microplitis mediator]